MIHLEYNDIYDVGVRSPSYDAVYKAAMYIIFNIDTIYDISRRSCLGIYDWTLGQDIIIYVRAGNLSGSLHHNKIEKLK